MGWVSPQHEQTHGELTRYQAPLINSFDPHNTPRRQVP